MVQEQANESVGHGFDRMLVYADQVGQPPGHLAFGFHNQDTKIPPKPKALFKMASIRKLYDAAALTHLKITRPVLGTNFDFIYI